METRIQHSEVVLSAAPLWKEPLWLADVPASERAACLLSFHLGIAALYGTPEGTMKALAALMQCPESTLSRAKTTGTISPRLAIKVEEHVGRAVMPRELLCPEFFSVGE